MAIEDNHRPLAIPATVCVCVCLLKPMNMTCCSAALLELLHNSLCCDVEVPVCLGVRGVCRPAPCKPSLLSAEAASLSAGLQSSLLLSLYDQSEGHFSSQGLREKERGGVHTVDVFITAPECCYFYYRLCSGCSSV